MKKRQGYNLRFKQGDLMVVAPRQSESFAESWHPGPRLPGMFTCRLGHLIPGTAYLALSDVRKSCWRSNRKLYVEVMVNNKLVPVWASIFKMRKEENEKE